MSRPTIWKLALAIALLPASRAALAAGNKTLTASVTALTVQYTLPASPGNAVSDTLTATDSGTFFYVETQTVPGWLTVTQSGTANPTATVTLQANAVAGTMLPGTYTAAVTFQSTAAGAPTATVNVTLLVNDRPPTFSCVAPATLTWSPGAAYPTLPINCTSTGQPVAFAVTFTGSIAGSLSADHSGGVAYPWGTTITVSIQPALFLSNPVGSTLNGNIVLQSSTGTTLQTLPVSISITAAVANVTSLTPLELPVNTTPSATATVVVNGSGFVTGITTVQVTVGGNTVVLDPSAIQVPNSNSMILTLDASTFLSSAQTLTVGIQNPGVGVMQTKPIYVVTTPIIYSVTNSASFTQNPNSNPLVSAYELISIFGANFDSSGGQTANTLNGLEMYVDPAVNGNGQQVKVMFFSGLTQNSLLADAPVIFVSNNQINAIVPAEVTALLGVNGSTTANAANIQVSINNVTNDSHNPVPVDVAAATPGIFTPSGSGIGPGAVLNSNWTLNTPSAPALHGSQVHIYATGLGAPTSTSADSYIVSPPAYPGNCLSTNAYLGVLKGTTNPPSTPLGTQAGSPLNGANSGLTSINGAVIATANIYAGLLPPCFPVTPTGVQVKFGTSATATVPTYAGFVWDSIAGLYQIDVTLPSAFTPSPPTNGGPIAMTLTVGTSATSQSGVTIYVK